MELMTKNTLSHSQLSYMLEKKQHFKVTYFNRKGNTKKHTSEETL